MFFEAGRTRSRLAGSHFSATPAGSRPELRVSARTRRADLSWPIGRGNKASASHLVAAVLIWKFRNVVDVPLLPAEFLTLLARTPLRLDCSRSFIRHTDPNAPNARSSKFRHIA